MIKQLVLEGRPTLKGLSADEIEQVKTAAANTVGEIAYDAAQLGGGMEALVELTFDAGRLISIGGLDKSIYDKLFKLNKWNTISKWAYEDLYKMFKYYT